MFNKLKAHLYRPAKSSLFCRTGPPSSYRPARPGPWRLLQYRPAHPGMKYQVLWTCHMTVCVDTEGSVVNQITEREDVCQAAPPGYWKHAVWLIIVQCTSDCALSHSSVRFLGYCPVYLHVHKWGGHRIKRRANRMTTVIVISRDSSVIINSPSSEFR